MTVDASLISAAAVAKHVEMLAEKVFQVDTKWPHFRLLLKDLARLADELPVGSKVVGMERTLLYGGISLAAPVFHRHEYVSFDGSPDSADVRGAYNAAMVDDPRTIRIAYTKRGSDIDTGLPSNSADAVTIPNLIHHVGDQTRLFDEVARILRPNGILYVFEPLVRELHQAPDDFIRYTPFGLQLKLKEHGFETVRVATEGGPFQVIAYCWEQALQYLPEEERTERAHWFWNEHFPELMRLDETHQTNLLRRNSSFPMAFSVTARRSA